ncbi:GntR family transcriptional regulator [Cellulophaga tyrosinoxydans]|uniref:Substrate-binding protein-like domain-containing protein n=1 Tax=Cellulophaga tyrosinoxydans TaxID=504486 RepID=A0A1W2C2I9_9FLAO|nr:GntR family transcriptional regulator [Cellulophaga tyrosinoxydans]SMC79457.1 substrate-binding protein-like domain-containing protein [Cellulophaga tyrosinoxydans]
MINLKNIENYDIPKYMRVFNAYKEAIETKAYQSGQSIPSINEFSKLYSISRDTVFKAYKLLKNEGYINSTPHKGYYIADSKIKVLLLISTFKAYKEVLYHSFMQNLPDNVIVDLQFHHYNVKNFKSMLNTNNGGYYKYIIMGFKDPEVIRAIHKIEADKLLLIDWDLSSKKTTNYLLQDFGKSFYNCLEEGLFLFKKYEALNFLYPEFTYHPWESVVFFKKFCKDNGFKYKVIKKAKEFIVNKKNAYITVNDRMLYGLLDQCLSANYELGKDVGVLSYNETPIKRFTFKGISVVSIDFKDFGIKAAEFVTKNEQMQTYLPTKLILRESL